MAFSDLVPWNRNQSVSNTRSGESGGDPFIALHREMNRVFDGFFRDFNIGMPARGAGWGAWPNVEVSDAGSEMKVVAELPGLEQNDVELSLDDGVLTIKGEKKSETNGALYSERWHGQFQRSLQLGPDVDPDKVNATFKNGVLTITLAKRPETQRQVKRIQIAKG
jgi:HSP20 family protein